jgi:hypothetical protein
MTSRAYTIAPLTIANYSTWSIKIEILQICSKIWNVVDGLEIAFVASNAIGLATRKQKDSKARSDILLHCDEKQLILLKPLSTSKAVWKKLKQLYERFNKESQVNLHK